jgi:hypothetical protein
MEFLLVLIAAILVIVLVVLYKKFARRVNRVYRIKQRRIYKKYDYVVLIINIVMPIWGIIGLLALKKDVEFFDWRYSDSLFICLFLFIACFFTSFYLKEVVGPLLLLILAVGMILGCIFLVAIFLQLIIALPFAIIPPLLFYGFPVYAIIPSIILFIKELQALNFFIQTQVNERGMEDSNPLLILIRASPLLLPVSLILLAVQYVFNQKSSPLVKAFTEASEGVFASGICENCPPMSDYLCTIAAQGFPAIVKPLRKGVRLGQPLLVNRQLLVSNAFEEWLMIKFPKIHKPVRKTYDALNIPVNKWCRYKFFATIMYFLWKPLEYCGLLCIYLFVHNPEDLINRQYYQKRKIIADK